MNKNIICFLGLTLSLNFAFAVTELKSIPSESEVTFDAIGRPSMLRIKGKGTGVSASFVIDAKNVSGTATFSLETLKTGIDLRDEHMKEKYLQTKQFPEAVLTLVAVTLPPNFSSTKPLVGTSEFTGKLKLHGVVKDITGKFAILDENLKTEADFEIKLSDYNIDIPTYLGVKVADIVKVHITFNMMDIVKNDVK